jgi:GST-like protein
VADIAAYPFIATAAMFAPDFMAAHPNIARWAGLVAARPAVQKGMAVPPPAFAKPS